MSRSLHSFPSTSSLSGLANSSQSPTTPATATTNATNQNSNSNNSSTTTTTTTTPNNNSSHQSTSTQSQSGFFSTNSPVMNTSSMKRTTSTSSIRSLSLAPTTLTHTPSTYTPVAPIGTTTSTIATAPSAPSMPSTTPSTSTTSTAIVASPSTTTHHAAHQPLQPLIKLPENVLIYQLPRQYITNHNNLVVGVSIHLPVPAQKMILEYIDLFVMNVLAYSNQWYYITAALSLDPTCILVNLLSCDFFVAVEDLPSALQCLKRVKKLLGNEYSVPPIHTVQLQLKNNHSSHPSSQNSTSSGNNPNGTNTAVINPLTTIVSANNNNHQQPQQPQQPINNTNNDPQQPLPTTPSTTPIYNALHITTQLQQPTTEVLITPTTITKREVLYYHAYDAWLSGNMQLSLSYWLTIVSLYPHDIFASKRAQLLAFLLGNQSIMVNVQLVPTMVEYISQLQISWWNNMKLFCEFYYNHFNANNSINHHNTVGSQQASQQQVALNVKGGPNNLSKNSLQASAVQQGHQNNQLNSSIMGKQQISPWMSSLLHLLQTNPTLTNLLASTSSSASTTRLPPHRPQQPPNAPYNPNNTTTHPTVFQPSIHNFYHTFTRLSFYFGMLSFALEQTNSYLHALHSGYLGTLISLIQQYLYQNYIAEHVSINNGPTLTTTYHPSNNQPKHHHLVNSINNNENHVSEIDQQQILQQQIEYRNKPKGFPIYKDPWSHHGIFHALFSLSEHAIALPLALSLSPQWDTSMSFMFTHNWFHVALMYIELGAFVSTLALVDTILWKFDPKVAISLKTNQSTGSFDYKMEVPIKPSHGNPNEGKSDNNGEENNNVNDLNSIDSPHQFQVLSAVTNHSHFYKQFQHLFQPPPQAVFNHQEQLSPVNTITKVTNFEDIDTNTRSQQQSSASGGEKYLWSFVGNGYIKPIREELNIYNNSNYPHSSTTDLKQPGFYYQHQINKSQQNNHNTVPQPNQQNTNTDVGSIELGHVASVFEPFTMYNYYYSQPTWNVYNFLQVLGYQHVDSPDTTIPSFLNHDDQSTTSSDENEFSTPSPPLTTHLSRPIYQPISQPSQPQQTLYLYYGPHLDSVLHDSQRFLTHHRQLHQSTSKTPYNVNDIAAIQQSLQQTNTNNIHIVPPDQHDHYIQAVFPSVWKQYDVNYPITVHQEHLNILHEHATGNSNSKQANYTPQLYSSLRQYTNYLAMQHSNSNGEGGGNGRNNGNSSQSGQNSSPSQNSPNSSQNNTLSQYDSGHFSGLAAVMPLVNKPHSQDQTGAIGLLWRLELHAFIDVGLICYKIDHNDHDQNDQNGQNCDDKGEIDPEKMNNNGKSPKNQEQQQFGSNDNLVTFNVETNKITTIPLKTESNHSQQHRNQSNDNYDLKLCTNPILQHPLIPSLTYRFESILSYVNLNNPHQDQFFDVLVCILLARCRRLEELQFYIEQATNTVMGMPPQRAEQLSGSFLPIIQAILAFAQLDYPKAAQLLVPLFITSGKGSNSSGGGNNNTNNNPQTSGNSATLTQSRTNNTKDSKSSRSQQHHSQQRNSASTTKRSSQSNKTSISQRNPANRSHQRVSTSFASSRGRNQSTGAQNSSNSQNQSKGDNNTQIPSLPLTLPSATSNTATVDIVRLLSVFQQRITQNISVGLFSRFSPFITLFLTSLEQINNNNTEVSHSASHLKTLSPFTQLLTIQRYLQANSRKSSTTATSQQQPTTTTTSQHEPSTTTNSVLTIATLPATIALDLDKLACLGGSNEQRDVITDFFCIVLFLAQEYQLLLQVINYRLDGHESVWLRKLRAQVCTAMVLVEKEILSDQQQLQMARL